MARITTLLTLCAVLTVAAGCGGGGSPATVTGGPVLSNLEPASGGMAGGTRIVLRGENLANDAAGPFEVLVGGQPATQVTVVSDTEVECETPPGAVGAADAVLVNAKGESALTSGFMYHPPPTITSVTPAFGTRDGGVTVTATGSGFLDNDPGPTICLIELKALLNIVVISDTELQGETPSSWVETSKNVTVKNRNGEATLSGGFRYVGPVPTIASIDPTEGPRGGGTFVTVTGEHYTEAGGELFVRFGGAETSGTRIDDGTDTQMTCTTPLSTAPGWVDVTVGNNNGESTLPSAFYYIPAPILTAIVPNEGSITGGETVTITGDGFTAVGAGTTFVTIGGTVVTNLVISNDTTISCTVPAGAAIGSVDVDIVNGNGSDSLTGAYTYTSPCWWETPFGTAQSHSDDSSSATALGISFPFYGTSYTSLNVNSNGSITAGYWTTYSATTRSTYDQIAVCQRDLYPPSGGTIYSKQLSDRCVITYDAVPPLGGSGVVRAQAHLTDTGTICVIYNGTTVSTPLYCGIQPGLGGTVTTTGDLSSGPNTCTSSTPITESFGTFDLDGGFTMFVPNGSGGYTQTYVGSIP